MEKNDFMIKSEELYLLLSDTKKDYFSRIINKLLSVNFICRDRKKDADDYDFISENERLFFNFFQLLDYDFILSNRDKVARIVNRHNYNHKMCNKNTSIILLILRKLVFQNMLDLNDSMVTTITLKDLYEEMDATGLFETRLTQQEFKVIYQFLNKHNIAERIGDLKDVDTELIIYPTIKYLLPYTTIEEILNRIQKYKRGVDNEENDECEIS